MKGGVGLVTDILTTAPEVKILTTSRARLNVQGEYLFPVAGMDFPDVETTEELVLSLPKGAVRYSAIKLFLSSTRRIQRGFEPTAEDMRAITHICRLVEGMPLGIELAAAWMEALTPAEVAAEISQSFDFLETDLRDVPERQRSMRAVFDHSWKLLTKQEREVFQGLSVFRGGFTREAAQEVTGASLRELMALVNKSLLHRTSTGRYEMHELLRQYGAEKIDQSPAVSKAAHDRHCAYFITALQSWGEDLKGPQQQAALTEMDAEIENARAAWNWAVERGQMERLDQAIDGLGRFHLRRMRYPEGEAACRLAAGKLAATASGDELRVLAKVLTWQSSFNMELGHTKLAGQLLRQSLAILDGPELADQDTRPERAYVLLKMGGRQLLEQSLALYQALGDRLGAANVLDELGVEAAFLGAYGEAKQLWEESLAIR